MHEANGVSKKNGDERFERHRQRERPTGVSKRLVAALLRRSIFECGRFVLFVLFVVRHSRVFFASIFPCAARASRRFGQRKGNDQQESEGKRSDRDFESPRLLAIPTSNLKTAAEATPRTDSQDSLRWSRRR